MRRNIIFMAWAAALLLAGCTTPGGGAETVEGVTMGPGTEAHVLLTTAGAGPPLVVLEDGGLDVRVPEILHEDDGAMAGWVAVAAPANAAGLHRVVLGEEDGGRAFAFDVVVAEPEDALAAGDWALVDVALRTVAGDVAFTTRADVNASPLGKVEGYEPSPEHEPLLFQVSPGAGLPSGMVAAMEGAGVGHSISVEMPEFYGPTEFEEERPREESVPRDDEVERYFELPRETAEQQGLIDEDTREGDILDVPAPFPYRVDHLDEEVLRVSVHVEEGETFTFHDAWPGGTRVVQVDETVVFRTDPTVHEDFTWDPDWPQATSVVSLDEDEIVLRHSPEVGAPSTQMTQQGPVEYTVAALDEDSIVLSRPNDHPLAGATMVAGMTIVERAEAPPQQPVGP